MSDVYLPFPAIAVNGATLEETYTKCNELEVKIREMEQSDSIKRELLSLVYMFRDVVMTLTDESELEHDNIKVSGNLNGLTNGKGTITVSSFSLSIMPIVAETVDDSTIGEGSPE